LRLSNHSNVTTTITARAYDAAGNSSQTSVKVKTQ
jgi:hypothetical protein